MREIKFRAWKPDEKKMYPPEEVLCSVWALNRPQDFIAMQYTGLKDKNGKEIYEGDILKWVDQQPCPHCNKPRYEHELYTIVFKDAGFDCVNADNFMSCEIWESEMEVIGNIYENPELLDKANAV